jgi:membrane associated rhomboid family serine protease
MQFRDDYGEAGGREPLFNAPWPALLVVGSIFLSYVWQAFLGGGVAASYRLGFAPADLDHHRYWTLLTCALVHAGWAHAITNALFALAFGPPVARFLGGSPRGVAAFLFFYVVCQVISTLGLAVLHLHDPQQSVGASGAIAGLMGAASRLLGRGDRLSPIWSRPVISLGGAWILVNAILAVSHITPLMGGNVRIGWEAHIAGFVAGVLLIGPLARLAGVQDRADLTEAPLAPWGEERDADPWS